MIEATLDHEKQWMQSKEATDIYCSREPQLAFHQRIEFCLDLHNSSVKAMRFPPKSYQKDLESAEDRRESRNIVSIDRGVGDGKRGKGRGEGGEPVR